MFNLNPIPIVALVPIGVIFFLIAWRYWGFRRMVIFPFYLLFLAGTGLVIAWDWLVNELWWRS